MSDTATTLRLPLVDGNRRPADVTRKVKQALAYTDGPMLIHAECIKTDNVFPMIPAGAPLEEMLTEPPKHKMAKPVGST